MTSENNKRRGNPLWVRGGASPNPAGRPEGSRDKFSKTFVTDLARTWHEGGDDVLRRVMADEPGVYLRVCASLIPKDVQMHLTATTTPGGLSGPDYAVLNEVIAAVRQAIPDAGAQEPGAVLNFVLDAIRSASASPAMITIEHTPGEDE